MSKNSIYTFNYFQPKEYRFSLDSVFLAQRVAKHLDSRPKISEMRFLDLCSGCGVIGLEMAIHLAQINYFDFIESQNIYLDYFKNNLLGIRPDCENFNFLNIGYQDVFDSNYHEKYDLIVSNPPYFYKEEGLLSPNEFKNRCRFFLDSDYETLIKSIMHMLKINGEAFVLIRSGNQHGRDQLQLSKNIVSDRYTCELFDEIRGTQIMRIVKKL